MIAKHLLIVKNDLDEIRLLQEGLKEVGYQVSSATTLMKGVAIFRESNPDLILLDLNFSDGDGREILRQVRRFSRAPVIILTAQNDIETKIELLNIGADDYITTPFNFEELTTRIMIQFRSPRTETLTYRGLTVLPDRRRVLIREKELPLSPREFDYLLQLMRQPGRIYSREELMDVGKGGRQYNETTVDVHMANLRSKLGDAGAHGMIRTVRGIGYGMRLACQNPIPNSQRSSESNHS